MPLRHTIAPLLLALGLLAGSQASAANFAVLQRTTLGGQGGWDFLTYEPGSRHLFISRGTHVQVVDPKTATVVGDVTDTPGVHGMAVVPSMNKGYISNGKDNSITVIDLASLKTLGKIATPQGINPDFIGYDEASAQVAAFNGRSHNVSLINPVTDTLVRTVALPGKPETAVSDGQGLMFVAIEDKNEITQLDVKRGKVVGHWAVPGCEEPSAMAIDNATRRLFVGCHNNSLLVLGTEQGQVVAKLPIGADVDAIAFDPQTHLIFSAQADGSMTVLEEQSATQFRVVQTVTTPVGAKTLALNAQDHRVYSVTAEWEAPVAAANGAKPKRVMKPDSFMLLEIGQR